MVPSASFRNHRHFIPERKAALMLRPSTCLLAALGCATLGIAVRAQQPIGATAEARIALKFPGPTDPSALAPNREALPLPDQSPVPAELLTTGLTLADLEALALGNNPTLAQANARVEAARGRRVQAGLPPNPNVGYAANEVGNGGMAGQQGGYLGQVVPLGGKLRLSRAVADQEVRQALWQRDAQQWTVLNDVRIAFYDALVSQRMVEVTRRLVEIGEQGEQTAADLLRIGQVSRVDFLQARIESRTARIEWNNARNRRDAAWRHLAAIIGVPCLPAETLSGDPTAGIPELTWDDALCRILASSPELAAAQAGIARARTALERQRVEPVPDLDAQYSPQYDTGAGNQIHNVQATLNIPLFNRNQGNIRAAQAELSAAQRDVQRIELDLQSRLAAAFERYANARQQVDTYTADILPDAQTELDIVADGYRREEFGYLTLLTAQRTYFSANLAYLRALQSLRASAVEIEGYLLTGSLGRSAFRDDPAPTGAAAAPRMERIGQ
jgi:outer membrane protein, heavy metal efflux system